MVRFAGFFSSKRMVALFAVLLPIGALRTAGYQASTTDSDELPFSYYRGSPLQIGNDTQFVFDDFLVEDRWKLTRTRGSILKYSRNPVIAQDKPWEDAVGGSPSVLYDDKLHKYRMWFTCFSPSNYFSKKGPSYYTEYAESEDGYVWNKPRLKGFPFGGYDATNVVATGNMKRASSAQVMLNPNQSDPQKRFMIVYTGGSGLVVTYSPDGLHWGPEETRLLPYHSDTDNNVIWVPERHLWYLYCRPSIRSGGMGPLPEGQRHLGRRMSLATSPDLKQWSAPRTIFYPDERDLPDYDNVYVFRRHGVFLALYSIMNQEKGHSEVETYIATSRDGIQWQRMWDRKPLVTRGPEGSYDHGEVEPGVSPPIEMGEHMLFYYYAAQRPQDTWYNDSSVAMFRMRRDRFIGQTAGEQTGYLVTRQFILDGSKLVLNLQSLPIPYDDKTGGIQVEIIQAPDNKTSDTRWETPVAGFTMADADLLAGDALEQPVTWHGNSDLSALRGKAVYLRFKMKRATLYSFRLLK